MTSRIGLWLRWSWRDFRGRWVQILAISIIVAIGSGVYVGLSSNTEWRRTSYDASYAALASHDLTVATADGTFAPEGQLLALAGQMDHPEWVTNAEERLAVPTQVDGGAASGKTLLVPGRIVGVDVSEGGPHVDMLEIEAGRGLTPEDDGGSVVVLDSHFADHHGLPDTGELLTSGGPVSYAGTGYSPEYFIVSAGQASFLAEAGFAVMFAPLATAQALSGADGQVNELAVTLAEEADPQAAADELRAAVAASDLAAEVTPLDEERQYRRLYDDIEGDQKLFNIFAVLILGGAAFAAFNLTGRIVEAQRREIGIGMALGLDRTGIAVRPLLVGLQIALLGVGFGVLFGLWVGSLISDLNLAFVPLPVWQNDFQIAVFARGVALGLVLVMVATGYPVWRAVRVDPVDAIRSTHQRAAGRSRRGGLRLPGSSIHQYPIRNIVRSPRRTALTSLGIAAAIAVLVALTGMIDSFLTTIDQGEQEILADSPDRMTVTMDFFYPEGSDTVTSIGTTPGVGSADPGLIVGGALLDQDGDDIDVLISLIDLQDGIWQPTAVEGSLPVNGQGVVLAKKAAEDLDVGVGDVVRLRHPRRDGLGYSFVESDLPVAAIHPNPYRFTLYMDSDAASLMALEGIVNSVSLVPSDGASTDEVKETLFGRPGVAAVEGVGEVAATIRATLEDMLQFLQVIQGFVLLMALLIAFNSTSISSDERRREHATMFAFGLPERSVISLIMVETLLLGVMGTVLGIVAGRLLLGAIIRLLLPTTLPDLDITVDVAVSTYVTAGVLGVVAVSLAPLLTIRRLRRMDIPATLRVVE